jgi:hypothetical protein
MIRVFRLSTLFAALALVLGSVPAFAWVCCYCANATISSNRINLVGCNPSGPGDRADTLAAGARFTVTVRDIANNPVAGIPVVIEFLDCSGIRIASTQSYHNESASRGPAIVQGYTAPNGTVSFVVIGGASSRVADLPGCARFYIDSYLCQSIGVGTYDENNAGGVNGADVALFGTDLSVFGSTLFGGRSLASGAAICP